MGEKSVAQISIELMGNKTCLLLVYYLYICQIRSLLFLLYLYINSAMVVYVSHKMAANPTESPSSILVSEAVTAVRDRAEMRSTS